MSSIRFIEVPDQKEGTQALANKIVSFLREGKRVLWLIPDGSNLPIAVAAMNIIRDALSKDSALSTSSSAVFADSTTSSTASSSLLSLKNLTITLTDERYGPVGHPDSNWQQLHDAGMDFADIKNAGIKAYPILDGSSLAETVVHAGRTIERILNSTDVSVC